MMMLPCCFIQMQVLWETKYVSQNCDLGLRAGLKYVSAQSSGQVCSTPPFEAVKLTTVSNHGWLPLDVVCTLIAGLEALAGTCFQTGKAMCVILADWIFILQSTTAKRESFDGIFLTGVKIAGMVAYLTP
jgi:hypothetical protein